MELDGIIAAGVGTLLGGLVLWSARRADAAQPAPPPPAGGAAGSSDPCDLLASAGAAAVASCKAIRGAVDIGRDLIDLLPGPPDFAARDKTNLQLNGEVDIPLDEELTYWSGCHNHGQNSFNRLVRGSVARFRNGCTPVKGSPGWKFCASGTQDMWWPGCDDPFSSNGVVPKKSMGPLGRREDGTPGAVRELKDGKYSYEATATSRAQWMTGLYGDAATYGPIRPGETSYIYQNGKPRQAKFPLPLGPGQWGWYLQGRPFVCSEGVLPALVRDHRSERADGMAWACGAREAPPSLPRGTTPTTSRDGRPRGGVTVTETAGGGRVTRNPR